MTTATDASLLTAFARHRDEKAFRALAERHFGLIFHTALRRTANRALAQDISQEVLCILAKKAAFVALHPERLPTWLHRTTLFECTTAMRKENSQQRRLQRAYHEETPLISVHSPQHDSSVWRQALPHLDKALNEIPEADRRIVLLHFFESLSFPRIAALLGKTPAAVQKQSVRALVKLNRSLSRKGVAFSITVLASGLAAESAKAVPLSLLPSFTAHAVATSGGLTTGSSLLLMVTTHQKILVPCALVLFALPLGLQQLAIASAEQRLAKLPASLPATGTSPVSAPAAGRTSGTHVSTSFDLSRLAEEAWLATRAPSLHPPLRLKLQSLKPAELSQLLLGCSTPEIDSDKRHALAELLGSILGEEDPGAAVRGMIDSGWIGSSEPREHFKRWVRKEPAAAQAWLVAEQQKPEFADHLNRANNRPPVNPDDDSIPFYGSNPLSGIQGVLMDYLLATDSRAAKSYLESFPPDPWQSALFSYALEVFRYNSPLDPSKADNYFALMREKLSGDIREVALRALVKVAGDSATMDDFMRVPDLTDQERRNMAKTHAEALLRISIQEEERKKRPEHGLPGFEPVRQELSSDWLARVIPDHAAEIQSEVEAIVDRKVESYEDSLLKTLSSSSRSDEEIAYTLTSRRYRFRLAEALNLAEKIQNSALREATLQTLNAQVIR